MDGKLLLEVYHRLFPSPASVVRRRCLYSDAIVALIHCFAALTNHSLRWAHDKSNWPLWARRLKFPSYSQLNRRVKCPSVQALVESVGSAARAELSDLPGPSEKVLDGKPLVVGGFSKDKDARRGKAPGGWAKGYKLHALVDAATGAVDAWAVTPLDAGEATVARELLEQAAAGPGPGLAWVAVRGDSNYDSNTLYALAADAGALLIAPRKKPGTGLGHHPQHADRLRAIQRLEGGDESAWARESAAQSLREHNLHRNRVEQAFAHLTNVPFGLWALPNHVRRLARVRRWVRAKVALYHLYLVQLRRARTADSAAV